MNNSSIDRSISARSFVRRYTIHCSLSAEAIAVVLEIIQSHFTSIRTRWSWYLPPGSVRYHINTAIHYVTRLLLFTRNEHGTVNSTYSSRHSRRGRAVAWRSPTTCFRAYPGRRTVPHLRFRSKRISEPAHPGGWASAPDIACPTSQEIG